MDRGGTEFDNSPPSPGGAPGERPSPSLAVTNARSSSEAVGDGTTMNCTILEMTTRQGERGGPPLASVMVRKKFSAVSES